MKLWNLLLWFRISRSLLVLNAGSFSFDRLDFLLLEKWFFDNWSSSTCSPDCSSEHIPLPRNSRFALLRNPIGDWSKSIVSDWQLCWKLKNRLRFSISSQSKVSLWNPSIQFVIPVWLDVRTRYRCLRWLVCLSIWKIRLRCLGAFRTICAAEIFSPFSNSCRSCSTLCLKLSGTKLLLSSTRS